MQSWLTWNPMTDWTMTNEPKDVSFESEPGAAVAVSAPSFKDAYHSMTLNVKTSFEKFNLRDCVLKSCQELNRAEFFVLLQMSLLVFCPSLGLSIIFQHCDVDEIDDDQQENVDQFIEWTRNCTMDQQQTQQMRFSIQTQTQMTDQIQSQFVQFVQFVQQLIQSMQSVTDAASQPMTQTMTQSVTMQMSTDAHSTRDMNGVENGQGQGRGYDDGQERLFGGEGRQGPIAVKVTTKTWKAIVIHF